MVNWLLSLLNICQSLHEHLPSLAYMQASGVVRPVDWKPCCSLALILFPISLCNSFTSFKPALIRFPSKYPLAHSQTTAMSENDFTLVLNGFNPLHVLVLYECENSLLSGWCWHASRRSSQRHVWRLNKASLFLVPWWLWWQGVCRLGLGEWVNGLAEALHNPRIGKLDFLFHANKTMGSISL